MICCLWWSMVLVTSNLASFSLHLSSSHFSSPTYVAGKEATGCLDYGKGDYQLIITWISVDHQLIFRWSSGDHQLVISWSYDQIPPGDVQVDLRGKSSTQDCSLACWHICTDKIWSMKVGTWVGHYDTCQGRRWCSPRRILTYPCPSGPGPEVKDVFDVEKESCSVTVLLLIVIIINSLILTMWTNPVVRGWRTWLYLGRWEPSAKESDFSFACSMFSKILIMTAPGWHFWRTSPWA